jgi:hypothetical protein
MREKNAVTMAEIYDELGRLPKYATIFRQIYRPVDDTHEYINPYSQQEFEFINFVLGEDRDYRPVSVKREESVFMCSLRERLSDDIVPFYVSKAYDVRDGRRYVLSGRSRAIGPDENDQDIGLMLVKKSAEAYVSLHFNVELHYLEVKKHYRAGIQYTILYCTSFYMALSRYKKSPS